MSSRASRRARGRQHQSGQQEQPDLDSLAGATRQIGPLRFGLKETSVGVDINKLDAPTQAYDADATWVDYRPGRLSLFFGKRNRAEPDVMQSFLEVRYPPENFINTFWKMVNGTFLEKVNAYVSLWPDAARVVEAVPKQPRATQSHSEWVTFAYISHSGTAAALDFYYLSPSSIARFAQSKNIEGMRLRPVVRVQLTTFDLLDFVERLRPIAEDITINLPEAHRQPLEDVDDNERPA
jgi:hypothetical protein